MLEQDLSLVFGAGEMVSSSFINHKTLKLKME